MATALRTYLFTDLIGYAELMRTQGNAAAARVLRASRRLIREELARRRGAILEETVGDSVFVSFRSPAEAVRTAVAIVERVDRYNARKPPIPIRMKIAINAGESVRQAGGYVGSAVALASQLARVARASQILLTDTVHDLLRSADVPPMGDLGVWGPHGFGQTVHVYEVLMPGGSGTPGLTGAERRVLAILFTDIAKSTDRAVEVGDRGWAELVQRHHAAVRSELNRFGGVEIDTAGDGFFATFDSPSRAIECAVAIRDGVREMDLEVRQGIHVGECEVGAGKVSGVAVVNAARTREFAEPGEILVSHTVRDVVSGGQFRFTSRGTRSLKGIPGRWHLYSVAGSGVQTSLDS